MAITVRKSRREVGKLAQKRLIVKALDEAHEPEPVGPPLIFQAMEKMDGYTYPSLGAQLVLAGAKYGMSREVHVSSKQFVTKVRIMLDKKGA